MAFRDDLKKYRESQGIQATTPTKSTQPSTSGSSGSGGSFRDALKSYREKQATISLEGWVNATNAFLEDTHRDLGSWRSKDDEGYNSLSERSTALLAQADSWRKQYAGNDEAISYIDSVVEALSNARQGSRGYLDFYSQWDTEDSYKKWMQYSTPEGRQEQYKKNKARLEELEKKQRESRNYQPGANPYLSGGSTASGSPYAAVQQNPKVSKNDIEKEIDRLQKDIRLYERGGTDETGLYYGFKAADDYGKLRSNADYGTKSANRDFQNPSREDLIKRDTLNDSSSWYTDADGVYRDAFGNELKKDASGNWVNPNAQGYDVVDRLGLYLSASEEEKQEAVSVPVSMEGTWESVIKDGYDGNWELLTKDETDIYYYLLNTSGQETADKYLSDMKVELNRRNAQNSNIRYTEAFDEANALERLAMSIASTPAQLFSGAAGFIEDSTMTLMGKDINPYSAAHGGMHYSNIVRSEQAKEFDEATGGIAIPFIDFTVGDLYQAGMSAFDMAVGGRLGAGAYEVLMGMGAASSEAKRLYEQGASNSQIAWGGALAGAAEMVFEHASIENLINLKDADTVGQMVKNIMAQGGIEASEEGFTEIANTITNAIVMGDASDWAKLLVEHDGDYLAALIAKAQEVGNAAFSGFVSGSVGGGVQSSASYVQTQAQNKELGQYISGANGTDALMALAQEMAGVASGKDQKRLTSQSDRLKKDEFLTKGGKQRATGRLYNTVRSVVTEQNIGEISTALQEKGFSKKDATAIAGALAVQTNGMELTDKQQKLLQKYEGDEAVQGVLDEILGNEESGINQRAKSIAKFEFDTMRSHITSQMKQAMASQENSEADDTMDTLEEDGAESHYEASADGKTILKSNSRIVNIQEVADIRDGKMILKLDDGSTVDAEDVIYSSEGEALVYETIAQMGASVRAANILVKQFKATDGMDAMVFTQGISEAFRYGKIGVELSKIPADSFARKLNAGQLEYVHRQGKRAAGKQVAKEQATVRKNRTVAENAIKDSRSYQATLAEGIEEKSLTESQKVSYQLAGQIAEAAKVNIRVYAGKTGEHGYYNYKTDEIYLNLNATNKSRKSMMAFTLGHELVHRAKKGSPAKYEQFANFLVKEYGKQGSDIDAMIGEELAAAKSFKLQMTYDQAFEEVVCDACERMLLDTDAGKKLAEFGAQSKQNKSFLEDLKRWITEFLEKIRSIFEGVDPNSMAAKEFAKFDQQVKQILADMYVDMTIDAGENLSVIHAVIQENAQPISSDEILTDGAVVDGGSEIKYSIKSMKADIAEGQMFEDLKTFCGWTQKQVDELKKNLQNLVEYMTPYRDILDMNETYGREGRRFSPYKPNSDPLYKISMDFSTLCSKRLLTQYVIENLQLRENRPLSAEEQMAIRHMLNEYRKVEKGLQVACAMCYVEAARLKSPKQIQKWMDDPATAMRNYFADKNPEFAAYIKEKQSDFKESRGYARNATKKDMSAKDVRELNKIRPRLRSQYQVSAEEAGIIDRAKALPNSTYLTAANLANLSETEPTIYSAYTAFVRTATRSKSLETDEPYYYGDSRRDNGNGIVVTDDFIEAVNRENGMRFSSWSDWRIQHMLDYITAVIDNSVRGAAMHGYTKFGEEVRVLGKTGMMFNMSGVAGSQTGLNEDGTLSFSPTESIDVNEAVQLREEFPDTAGLQCIGVGDDHIVALLRSDIIDYVIPYHISGLNAALRRMANIQGWADYTSTQHAAIDKSMKLENAADKEHWHEEPVWSEFFVGYNTGMTGIEAMRASADRYVQMCKDRGLKPKFEQFLGEENYWKLLIDRKMINQKTGKLIQQRAVTPTFDFGTIKEVVDRHVQNYDSNLEARALNHIVENWDSIPKHIKDLKSTKAKKSVDTLANQTLAAQPADDQKVYSLPKGEPAPTFYSHMARVVDGVKQEKLGAASVVSMLRGKGVKVEEIKWSGIEAFLDGKKSVTKAELQEFIAGSMLQIEEDMLTDQEIPYSQEHLDQIAKYEAERDIIAENLKSEWKRIVGTDIPITYFGAGLESAVVNNLLLANSEKKGNTDAGHKYKAARAALQRCIEYSDDYFGFDNERQAFREAVRNPVDFMNSYDLTAFEKSVFRDFIKAKEAYNKEEGISVEDQKALKAIAESADRFSNRINKVKTEHRTEAAKYLTKYRSYTIKGGSNYRELLFRMPGATYSNQAMSIHWERSGVLAHARIQDLNTFLGKMLFIEEIQSDWHNEGHRSGYTSEADMARISEVEDEIAQILTEKDKINQEYDAFLTRYWEEDLPDEEYRQYLSVRQEALTELSYKQRDLERELNELAAGNDVPDAPFKDTYHEYVLKRLLRMAAEQDYDSIGWTTAQIQMDRWSDEYAEGYRIEYDQDIPKFLNKYGKKWGTKVGKTVLDSGTEVWSMAITDEMKDSVLYEGQVLYSLPKVEEIKPSEEQIETNIQTVAEMSSVHDIDASKLEKSGKKLVDIFGDQFAAWGYNIHSDLFGDIEIKNSSIRSELRHGFTPVKIASIEAIPSVIKSGKIVDWIEKNNGRVFRIVVAAPITIGNTPYIMGVMLQRDNLHQRLYLHDVVIEKEASDFSRDDLVSTGSSEKNENLFMTSILQKILKVKQQNKVNKLPVGEDTSPRALLANAFEGVAQNEIERNKIQEYKSKIELINAEEKKLSELNEKIKELSFAKGPKDIKAIRALQFEAMQTSNRINTYDKQLLRLEGSKPLQNVLTREKEMARKRAEQKGKEALAEYRERAAKTQRDLLDKWQASREKAIDSRQRTAMRHKIKNVVNDLNQYLLKGTKERHVPIGLQKAVAEALNAVNMDTIGAEERIAKLNKDLLKAKTPEEILEISKKIEHIREMGDRMDERLKKLKEAYDEFINSDDPMIANSHDDGMSAHMMKLIVRVGDTPLREMTVDQLQDVYDVYKVVLATIRNANKSFKDNKNREISTRANQVMAEIDNLGVKKGKSIIGFDWVNKFGWDNLKPVYAMEHIGSRGLIEAYNNVRAGEDTWAKDIVEAREFYLEKFKKYKYDSWDFEKKYKFTSTTGKDFELTLDQIMSLYAYSKREQAEDHLRYGGIVFDPKTEVVEKTKSGIKVKYNVANATAYNISADTLGEIISILKDEQTDFVDEMQAYLSDVMGAKGNEVSLAMYDVKLFREKHYFPLKSAPQYMAKAKEQAMGEVKIKNSGFSKETKPHAKNPIVLSSFMDVWTNHVNEMSMYHAFVLPMEDFYRIYNYVTPSKAENMPTEGVTAYIENAYGSGATGYIEQMLKDLNGGARTDSRTGLINKMMGWYKKGAVFASASVVVQQPSAIARAAALIDIKHFIGPKVDAKRHKLLWNEVKQYAPVAIIKEMGYFDTNMGKSTQDFIQGKEYSGIKEKAKALVTDSNYRDEVLSKAPALADELAWCSIWEAVKRETKERNPKMDVRSEEFLKLAGERFTEVIVKTQVYDSVLARSANMRSKDTGMKMVTAFMAEPTTSINMIGDALLKGKRGDKKFCRKAIGSVIASVILNSFLVAWVQAARDDDEEESYAEKYIGSFTAEMLEGLNPLTYIPFIKDIVSIVQGYDVERSDMSVISDVVNAVRKLSKEDVSGWKKVEDFVGSICMIFGLPVKNIMRDTRAGWQAYNTIVNGENTTKRGIGYAVKESITGKSVSNPDQLYDSRLAGDEKHKARVETRYEDEDSANAAVRQSIMNRFLEGEIDKATALKYMILYAGMEANEAHWTMDAWEYRKETGSDEGYGKYNDFFTAVQTGKNLKATIKEYTDNGVELNTLTSQLTQHFKPQYIKMSTAEKANIKGYLLNGYEQCGLDREDAEEKLAEWDFEAKHGYDYGDRKKLYLEGELSGTNLRSVLISVGGYTEEEADAQIEAYDWEAEGYEGATAAAVREYNEHCAAMSVPKSVYLYIRQFANNTENDVDENGKSINYSAMKKIMAEINAQRLTAAQKTAIARSLGWSEKNINKYKPW